MRIIMLTLAMVLLAGCKYKDDNLAEEIAESVAEQQAEQRLGLPEGSMKGKIDFTPGSPENAKKN